MSFILCVIETEDGKTIKVVMDQLSEVVPYLSDYDLKKVTLIPIRI